MPRPSPSALRHAFDARVRGACLSNSQYVDTYLRRRRVRSVVAVLARRAGRVALFDAEVVFCGFGRGVGVVCAGSDGPAPGAYSAESTFDSRKKAAPVAVFGTAPRDRRPAGGDTPGPVVRSHCAAVSPLSHVALALPCRGVLRAAAPPLLRCVSHRCVFVEAPVASRGLRWCSRVNRGV